jgi:hypothetical protein
VTLKNPDSNDGKIVSPRNAKLETVEWLQEEPYFYCKRRLDEARLQISRVLGNRLSIEEQRIVFEKKDSY